MLSRLFESLLQENKDRFIDKAFATAYGDGDFDEDYADSVKKFANSSAVGKYKIDWQQSPDKLFTAICSAYNDYISKGGSRSQRAKASRKDPKTLFERAPLKAVHAGEDTSGADLAILDSLENDEFVFVCPLTWKACIWLDSFECGGQGAKWCLGWKDNDTYWKNYTSQGDLFVMAFSKTEFAEPSGEADKLKFMVELAPSNKAGSTQVWLQSDSKDSTLRGSAAKKLLGHSFNDLAAAAVSAVGSDSNAYTECAEWSTIWGVKYEDALENGDSLEYYDSSMNDGVVIRMSELFGESISKLTAAAKGNDTAVLDFAGDTGYACSSSGKIDIMCPRRECNSLPELLRALDCKEAVIKELDNAEVTLDGDISGVSKLCFRDCSIDSLMLSKSFLERHKDSLELKSLDYMSVSEVLFADCTMDDAARYMKSKLMSSIRSIADVHIWDSKRSKVIELDPWAMFSS